MDYQQFANVWDAIEDDPEAAKALAQRSSLMMSLASYISRAEMTSEQAADFFGTTTLKISDLLLGRIHLLDIDGLSRMEEIARKHPLNPSGLY